MEILFAHRSLRVTVLALALVWILWLVLARAGTVHAAGVVTDCSNDNDLDAQLAGGGLVTFNCALPAPIIITITTGGGIIPAPDTTLDGSNNGNPITLSGGGSTRLFHHLAAGGTLTLTHLTLFDGNAGSANGGCLFNEGGTSVLVDVTVTHCKVGSGFAGGGIYNSGTATLNNSTLSGNAAMHWGGGIYNHFDISLWNVTLSDNSATTGGALYMVSGYTSVLTNTILAYSPTGGNCSGNITLSKYSIDSDSTCGLSGTGDSNVDPLLTALGYYGGPTLVHMLKLGSPAINGIVGNDAPKTDQRGFARPVGAYDIGAVERQPGDSDLAPRLDLLLIVK